LVTAYGGQIIEENFAADVTVTARFGVEHFPAFQQALQELARGAWGAEIIETAEAIVPSGSFGDRRH
jgi:hypothetical protein